MSSSELNETPVLKKDANGREILLEVKNLAVTFYNGKKEFRAVHDINFNVYKGETFALVGESGSGKTTIGRAIMRIHPTSAGDVYFEGKRINQKLSKEEVKWVVRNIQMVFQDPAASLNERATIDYIVSEGISNFHLYKDEEDRKKKVMDALESVGLLAEHATRYPHEFSGGQRQRIGIARAMIMNPTLLIADEPISALDVSIRAQVLNLLNKFKEERGLTQIFIAHDLSVIRYISDRIAVIHKGRIVELAETNELFQNPMHPYTQSLMSAIPLPDPEIEKNKTLMTYSEEEHAAKWNYAEHPATFREIIPGCGHYIFANDEELKHYQDHYNK
ncbi:MAG: ATP-binding cassette domain-containing protein [Erysipelotrichaceae bacterium]|nr:ATP-binding cassette domain-containing protein [Erysipelotrichaceae bacterium]